MAKSENSQTIVTEIRKNLETKRLAIGTDLSMRALRSGRLEKVYITTNCPQSVKDDFAHYSQIAGVTIVNLEMPNDELGTICKKPFSISVVGLLRV